MLFGYHSLVCLFGLALPSLYKIPSTKQKLVGSRPPYWALAEGGSYRRPSSYCPFPFLTISRTSLIFLFKVLNLLEQSVASPNITNYFSISWILAQSLSSKSSRSEMLAFFGSYKVLMFENSLLAASLNSSNSFLRLL